MSQDPLSGPLQDLLAAHCTTRHVRQIEAGASAARLWHEIQESGFGDALVPESRGGAGLTLTDVFPVFLACGRSGLPLPLGFTIVARAVLASAGLPRPNGAITFASARPVIRDGQVVCTNVPYGRVSQWVLADVEDSLALLPIEAAAVTPTGVHGSLDADLSWLRVPAGALRIETSLDTKSVGACVHASQLAGAMERILASCVAFANERAQFGKTIGKFQAVQQQLSVMAEQVVAARIAAEIGCRSSSHLPQLRLVAVAKLRTSEAAVPVASIAHALHGAMGITEEYDLQLFTRRLHSWRSAFGSEAYWGRWVGEALMNEERRAAADFVREALSP